MNPVTYKQGNTVVWCDGEKIKVTNSATDVHVKDNVEQIFGMGEWDKIYDVKYYEKKEKSPVNPLSFTYEVLSGYIPERVVKDLAEQSLPGIKDKDLLGEYFE